MKHVLDYLYLLKYQLLNQFYSVDFNFCFMYVCIIDITGR